MILVHQLSKRYGRSTAVVDVSFTCPPGTITGFLGPNGAGKSTTLRMMTGLTPPTSGGVTIAGRRYAEYRNPGRTIGVMLDASAQHRGRTGIETLRLAGRLLGVPKSRADDMIELVGLGHAAARRVGSYSLGMRQRLGIGTALLGSPEVLILDEPANGMDPEGIRWMRGLVRGFAADGGTALLSSHLLAEVEATVDRLVVINGGSVVAEGELPALLGSEVSIVRCTDTDALAAELTRCGLAYARRRDGAVRVDAPPERVGRIAAGTGLVLVELRADGNLEDLFFRLTAADRPSGSTTVEEDKP